MKHYINFIFKNHILMLLILELIQMYKNQKIINRLHEELKIIYCYLSFLIPFQWLFSMFNMF